MTSSACSCGCTMPGIAASRCRSAYTHTAVFRWNTINICSMQAIADNLRRCLHPYCCIFNAVLQQNSAA